MKLVLLLKNNLSAVFKIDSDGTIFAANATAHRMFGYENGELNGKRVQVVLPQSDHRQIPFGALDDIRSQIEQVNTIEAVGLKKDDTEFPVEIVLTACEGYYVCQVRDISRRQLSESMDGILHTTLRRVLRGQTYEEFCAFLCEKIVELLGCPLVWIGRKEKNGSVCVCAASGKLSAGFPANPIR